MTIKPCKTCGNKGYFQDGTPGCSLLNRKIDLEKDFCSWHRPDNAIAQCDLCKQNFPINSLQFWIDKDAVLGYWVCENCMKSINTCNTCKSRMECGFENDHSEPHIVMQRVQNGFMNMQTQVKNPHLVQKHCHSCKCWDGEKCMHEENGVNCRYWCAGTT